MPRAQISDTYLTEGDMDYVLSILRHQVSKKTASLVIPQEDLVMALSIVRKNDEKIK